MAANSVALAYGMVDWSMPESMRMSLISGKSAAGLSPEALEKRVCGYERQKNKILLSGVCVRRHKEGSASCEYSGSRWVRKLVSRSDCRDQSLEVQAPHTGERTRDVLYVPLRQREAVCPHHVDPEPCQLPHPRECIGGSPRERVERLGNVNGVDVVVDRAPP